MAEQKEHGQQRIAVPGGRAGEVLTRRFGRPWGADWEAAGTVLFCRATADLTLTTTAQSITGNGDSNKVRLLLPTIGEWTVEAVCDIDVSVAAAGILALGELFVNDSATAEVGWAGLSTFNTIRASVSQQWKVITTAANTPVELKGKISAAGPTSTIMANCTTLCASTGTGGSGGGGGGATDFLGLSDTPDSYAGQALKTVRVNAIPNALEFYDHEGAADPHTVYGALAQAETWAALQTFNAGLKLAASQAIKDSGGNNRFTPAASGTNVTLTGQTLITGRLGVMTPVPADDSIIVNVQPTISDAIGLFPVILKVNPTLTSSAASNLTLAVEGINTTRITNAGTCSVYGLSYVVLPYNFDATACIAPEAFAVVGGLAAGAVTGGSLTVNDGGAFKASAVELQGVEAGVTITRCSGFLCLNQGYARIVKSYGIYVAAQAGSIAGAYGIYIENAATYALWVDAGLSRFDGDGVRVWELPADATVGSATITGRIPVLIGGVTRYIHYHES